MDTHGAAAALVDPGAAQRRAAAWDAAQASRAGAEGLLALSLQEAKAARGVAYKAEADRKVAVKGVKRRLAQAMKDPRLNLEAALKAAEALHMYDDCHYKLAAERLVGKLPTTADGFVLSKWLFVNKPATERRVLRYFHMRWNSNTVQFSLERDGTGRADICICKHNHGGVPNFAQCYTLSFGDKDKGTTAGGNSCGGWQATEGPESEGVESGIVGGEDWEQGVLRIIDADRKVWDLTAVREHSEAWCARSQELESNTSHPNSSLLTWKQWIEASIDAFKEDEIEAERQRRIALGCHAGPPIKGLMAYRGANPQNWNKSSIEELRDDMVADKSLTRLFLEQNTLKYFPTNMLNMTSLTELWLGHNQIDTVDAEVMRKFALRTPLAFLSLDCNFVEEIPPTIGDLSVLQELRLSANGLKKIPPSSVGRLDALTTLWLQNNCISLLPDDMGLHLQSLQLLFLNNNDLTRLPFSVSGWTTLVELHVHENRLEYLPEDTYKMCSLRVLKASTNSIQVLPARMDELTSLGSLYLGHNQIARLSEPDGSLLRLSALMTLHVESNLVLEIPLDDTRPDSTITRSASQMERAASCNGPKSQGIVGLSSLTDLRLDCNKLLIVPPDVGRMTRLRSLCLAFNRIQYLPVELGQLRDLETLTLHENPVIQHNPILTQFSHDPVKIVEYYHEEKEQNLRNQSLSSVPGHVPTRLQLQALYLSHNNIAHLPATLHVLRELRVLHVDHNDLFIIEPWIGSLESLCDLALDNNRLLSVPSTLGLLTQLQILTLQSNSIASLPQELGLCTRLQTLNVEHNPLRPPFSDALEEGGALAIIELMFDLGAKCRPPSRVSTAQTMRFSQ